MRYFVIISGNIKEAHNVFRFTIVPDQSWASVLQPLLEGNIQGVQVPVRYTNYMSMNFIKRSKEFYKMRLISYYIHWMSVTKGNQKY